MKSYKVELKDQDEKVVLSHNLLAKDELDAEVKCNALVTNARDKRVVTASFILPS